MKKFFKWLLIVLGIILLIAGVTALVIALKPLPTYKAEKPDIKIEYTPQRVQQGTKLASMLCKSCHYSNDTKKFTGRQMTEVDQFGTIVSKNITNDSVAGIRNWTDGQLVYFIRTGIHPTGKYVPPYMPKLIHISDEDLFSVISFLRSDHQWVQADNTRQPETKPSFLVKFLCFIGAFKPFDYPTKPIPGPDTTDQVKLGKYIALYQLECFACHSKDFAKNDYLTPENSPGFFGGGNELKNEEGKKIISRNLTMDTETGIGTWTEDDFVKAVKSGIHPKGEPALRNPMQPYSNLEDSEAKAIFAYLKTIPVIKNKVERKF